MLHLENPMIFIIDCQYKYKYAQIPDKTIDARRNP